MFQRFGLGILGIIIAMQFILSGIVFAGENSSRVENDFKPANVSDEEKVNAEDSNANDGKAETASSRANLEVKITVKPEEVESPKKVEEKSPFSGRVRFRQQFEEYEGEKKPRWRTRIRADFSFLKETSDFNLGITLRTGTGISNSGSYAAGNTGNVDVKEMSNLGVYLNQAYIAYKASSDFWWVLGRYPNNVGRSAGFSVFTSEISFEDIYSFDGMSFFAKPMSDLTFWLGITPFLEKRQNAPKDNIYTVLFSTQLSYTAKMGDNKLQVGAGFWGFMHPENLPEIQADYGYGKNASPGGDDEYLLTGELFAVLSLGSMLSFKIHGLFNLGATNDPFGGYLQVAYGNCKNPGDFSVAMQLIYLERYAYYHRLTELGVNLRGFQFVARYMISKSFTVRLKVLGANNIIAGSSLTGSLIFKLDFEASF